MSIVCRYVRTHAMGADKAVKAVQVQSSVFGLCRRHSGPQTSQAARQLRRRYNFISLLRLNTTTKANSSSIELHMILPLILVLYVFLEAH